MNLDDSQPITEYIKGPSKELLDLAKYVVNTLPFDTITFGGGLIMPLYTGEWRFTRDINIEIETVDQYLAVVEAFTNYGEYLVEHGIIGSYEVTDCITCACGGGVKFRDATNCILFSADVSLGSGDHLKRTINLDGVGKILAVTLESIIADKLYVLFSDRRYRILKDLPDVSIISKLCVINLDTVRDLMSKRESWPLNLDEYPLTEERLIEYQKAFRRFKMKMPDGWDRIFTSEDLEHAVEQVSNL